MGPRAQILEFNVAALWLLINRLKRWRYTRSLSIKILAHRWELIVISSSRNHFGSLQEQCRCRLLGQLLSCLLLKQVLHDLQVVLKLED